jgi:hypothetical protein
MLRDEAAFYAEYQNDPVAEQTDEKVLTIEQVIGKKPMAERDMRFRWVVSILRCLSMCMINFYLTRYAHGQKILQALL